MMMKMGTTTKMIDIKDRLARLSALAKGPELIWPHTANVADAAVARIEELEAERDARIDPAHVQALLDTAEPAMAEAIAALQADNARYRAALQRIANWPSYRLPSAPDIARAELERKIVSNG